MVVAACMGRQPTQVAAAAAAAQHIGSSRSTAFASRRQCRGPPAADILTVRCSKGERGLGARRVVLLVLRGATLRIAEELGQTERASEQAARS